MILVLALGLRAGFAWDYIHRNPERALSTIPFLFEPGNIAASIEQGKGFSSPLRVETGPTAWMTPIYPMMLAGVFHIFGLYTFPAFLAAVGLNIAFSTLTVVPIFYAGRRVSGIVTAALAAGLWAIFPNAILLPFESLWDASLAALLAALLLWATVALDGSPRLRGWFAYALLWGVALMTNATLVLALPFLLGWLAWRSRSLTKPALAAGLIILCCVPWTIRNALAMHSFIPLRSVAGLSLWIGNNDQIRGQWPGRLHPITNSVERNKYVEMGEIAYMREKRREAVEFILAHPAEELRLTASRFVALWSGGTATPLADLIHARSFSFRFILLFNLLAAGGALAGMVMLWRRGSPYWFPLAVFPVIFPLAYYVTLASARYRHPADPAVLLLTAVALKGIRGR